MILDKFNTINEYINVFKINKVRFYKNGLYELIVPNLIKLKTCKSRTLVKSYLTMVKIILSFNDDDDTYGFIIVLNRSL
jgi:hypothetical protein